MKLLIVEDEAAIAELIVRTITWEDYGFDRTDTASNGEQALEMCRQNAYDIVISDIEMPIMNGLDLLRNLNRMENVPEVLFLTCHEDFKYLQTALREGAVDYVLKPFHPESLIAAVSKAILQHQEKEEVKKLSKNVIMQEQKIAENKDAVLQGQLRSLLEGLVDESPQAMQELAERTEERFSWKEPHRLFYYGVNLHESGQGQSLSRNSFNFIFRNILCEIFTGGNESPYCIDFYSEPYLTWVFLVRDRSFHRAEVAEHAARLQEAVERYMGAQLTCIFSEKTSPEDLYETKKDMDYLFFKKLANSSKIIFLDDVYPSSGGDGSYINPAEIVRLLREQKKIEFSVYIKQVLMNGKERVDAAALEMIYQELLQCFYGYLYENHINVQVLMSDPNIGKMQDSASRSAANLMKYAGYMFDYIQKAGKEARKSDSVVEKAKRFMEEHCRENIGRAEIADSVGLAPNYLSMLFNKETGQTLRDYLNYCRVEEAKKMMASTSFSITDIALQVGYDNIPYFSTIFKKYTGMKPAEYRSSLK